MQNSKKRVARSSSPSSSSAYVDLDEVIEIPPPPPSSNSSRRNYSKSLNKNKDVAQNVIVIDINEDLSNEKVCASLKGKDVIYISDCPDDNPIKNPRKSKKNLATVGSTRGSSWSMSQEDPILKKLQSFKRFDMVDDFSDHKYAGNSSSGKQPLINWAKKIQDEWRILEKDLPDEIFVRVYESRMDLLRAVIIGAEGTPYHHGLFFFDVYFPSRYPNEPPHVQYHSGGLRLNPNLYECGKVCLSLLNTWHGSNNEKWVPGMSTMLQVLVSIQALILNANPYFNEPAYANLSGSESGQKKSEQYNEDTLTKSLQTMLYTMRKPPKHFEDLVVGHFYKQSHDILLACKAYMDGAQVGSLVQGGVQDVDESHKSCSKSLKKEVAGYLNPLVQEFTKIGAKDCEKFIVTEIGKELFQPLPSMVPSVPYVSFHSALPMIPPLNALTKPKILQKKPSMRSQNAMSVTFKTNMP